jgi:hypothetical protein
MIELKLVCVVVQSLYLQEKVKSIALESVLTKFTI